MAESRRVFALRVGEEGWKTGGADLQTALWRGWRMADSVRREKTEKKRRKRKERERERRKETRNGQKENIESRDGERGGGISEESRDRRTG